MPAGRARADAPGEHGVRTHLEGTAGWVGLRGRSCDPHSYSFWSRQLSRSSSSASASCCCALHPEMVEHEVSGFASTVQEFVRPELLMALGLSLVVLFGGALLSRPRGEPRPLDEPVAIGERPFFAPVTPPPTDEEVTRRGPLGTWADIAARLHALCAERSAGEGRRSPPRRGRVRQVPARHSLRQRVVRRERRDVDPARGGLRRLPGDRLRVPGGQG